jgi:glycosyltransferase involved in cell wall biosynthesis
VKILAITNSRIPSLTANSIQAMKMCDAMTQLGHEVKLLAPAEAQRVNWVELSHHYGVKHKFQIEWRPSARMLRRLDYVWYAQWAARSVKPDLIYTWLPQSAAFALGRRYPVVLEMHADVAGLLGPWWLRRFWKVHGRKRLLVTTQALKAALERSTALTFPREDVRIAPNGVDLDRYVNTPDAVEARHGLNLPECPTAGFTGHFYRGRGMDLLHALALALPDVSFLWVGGTSEAVEEWRTKLKASGVANVTLTGFVANDQLPAYQAAADVLLMPYEASVSSSSGQDIAEVINPMKMFEYMAAKRAIMTADLPSIREVLDDRSAVFCPPDDSTAWIAGLKDLLSDKRHLAELAQAARIEVEKYTWLARAEKALATLL